MAVNDVSPGAMVCRATVSMDTILQIQIEGSDHAVLNRAVGRAFNLAEKLCRQFSRFETGGEIGRLNAGRSPFAASARLRRLLGIAFRINRASGNAFSASPKTALFDDVAFRADGRTIERLHPGTDIDLGAIAKGFIIDEIVASLRRDGVRSGLVNAGGDVRAFGHRTWPIRMRHPLRPSDSIGCVRLRDAALCVSAQTFRPSHILDPRRGDVARGRTAAAAAIARTAAKADAWATALFVRGRQGLETWFHHDRMAGPVAGLVAERHPTRGLLVWKSKLFHLRRGPEN